MTRNGWSRLIPDEGTFHGSDEFRIAAYSEFMPPPRVGWKPYGPVPVNSHLLSPDDPSGGRSTNLMKHSNCNRACTRSPGNC